MKEAGNKKVSTYFALGTVCSHTLLLCSQREI